MIVTFGNKLARDLVEEKNSRELRSFPADLIRTARKKLNMLHVAHSLSDLTVPPGNRLHLPKGNRAGRHAISVNDQWRIAFVWKDGNAYDVLVEDYHR